MAIIQSIEVSAGLAAEGTAVPHGVGAAVDPAQLPGPPPAGTGSSLVGADTECGPSQSVRLQSAESIAPSASATATDLTPDSSSVKSRSNGGRRGACCCAEFPNGC